MLKNRFIFLYVSLRKICYLFMCDLCVCWLFVFRQSKINNNHTRQRNAFLNLYIDSSFTAAKYMLVSVWIIGNHVSNSNLKYPNFTDSNSFLYLNAVKMRTVAYLFKKQQQQHSYVGCLNFKRNVHDDCEFMILKIGAKESEYLFYLLGVVVFSMLVYAHLMHINLYLSLNWVFGNSCPPR